MKDMSAEVALEGASKPHVDVATPAMCGYVRLLTASGGLEAIWLKPCDTEDMGVHYAMLTPTDARALAKLLLRYASTHQETDEWDM